jgi:hypothetical protein
VKRPGETAYSSAGKVAGQQTGSFAFDAAGADGTYSFYTVATDLAGNVEAAPATADTSTLLDRTGPSSSATSPAFTHARQVPVRYVVTGDAGSRPATVDLFVRRPGAPGYVKVASDTGDALDGEFTYRAGRQGGYRFYTVATDAAGNVETTPSRADTKTRVDRAAPVVEPRTARGAAGLVLGSTSPAALRMWVSERGETSFVIREPGRRIRVLGPADTRRGVVTGSWDLRDDEGGRVRPGRYVLVMKATDRAGNLTTVRTPLRLVR